MVGNFHTGIGWVGGKHEAETENSELENLRPKVAGTGPRAIKEVGRGRNGHPWWGNDQESAKGCMKTSQQFRQY